MSENDVVKAGQVLDEAQVSEISGGLSCSADELLAVTRALKESYDNLVDFTSHVIERVLGN